MWKMLLIGSAVTTVLVAQTSPSAVELANLREDVRGLTQRVGEMALRIEQLERENRELRAKSGANDRGYATLQQLNQAVEDVNHTTRAAIATSKTETLQIVATQLEKLGKQTNAALDSLAKAQAPRATATTTFSDDYPKETVTYTVQKGDSLASIAKKHGARQQDIINANKISDPSRIVVGQSLVIPVQPNSPAK